jgi:hypothetical protein
MAHLLQHRRHEELLSYWYQSRSCSKPLHLTTTPDPRRPLHPPGRTRHYVYRPQGNGGGPDFFTAPSSASAGATALHRNVGSGDVPASPTVWPNRSGSRHHIISSWLRTKLHSSPRALSFLASL